MVRHHYRAATEFSSVRVTQIGAVLFLSQTYFNTYIYECDEILIETKYLLKLIRYILEARRHRACVYVYCMQLNLRPAVK